MMFPEITIKELAENIESDDFCRRYGNPVMFKTETGYKVVVSFELYERLYGKVNLSEEKTMEMDTFVKGLSQSENV